MRLKTVILKNFRGYRHPISIDIDPNVTGITGRNDAGKSSILEALDIFFGGEEVSLDKDDFNVREPDGEIEISCIFDQLPEKIILDETASTSFLAEHLLNKKDELQILKRYKRSSPGKPTVFIIAEYPNAPKYGDLHTLKMADLKLRAKELGISEANVDDKRSAVSWRAAIWANATELGKKVTELEIGKFSTDAKVLQEKIFSLLPLFALFRADRESKDNDPHAKNPLQEAVKEAQREFGTDIERLQNQIQERVLARANLTIEKLKEMDPTLAEQLKPRFKTPPKWTFDFSLDGDDGIPINKRGSGVRRLILLNFFRAEAERKVTARSAPSVIYAIEEPENSQHPNNQEMLVQALLELGYREACQVLVTTHVPALAGILPIEGLRFVELCEEGPRVKSGSPEVLELISDSLGVLPDKRVTGAKGLILVEGPSDVTFVEHSYRVLKDSGHLRNTLEEKGIVPVMIGGCGGLKHWITKKTAEKFGIPWGIVLDSDSGTPEGAKNRTAIEELKREGRKAYVTQKREPENYLLPEVIQPHVKNGITIRFSDTDDAKKLIATATQKKASDVLEIFWPMMTASHIRQSERYLDEAQAERFELTEMFSDFLSLTE